MFGNIFKIESLSAVDGSGIRVVVFMHGCQNKCVYCHNPESFASNKFLTYSVDELVDKLLRFKPYFKNGGGVTFSGGEPLKQVIFINHVIKKLNNFSVSSIIHTSCPILDDGVKELFKLCESVIVDLKFYNSKGYEKYVGNDFFECVLKTLEFLAKINKPTTVKTVIINGINDTAKDIEEYKKLLEPFKNITHELVPFHTMGFSKYEELGLENPLKNTTSTSNETLAALQRELR